MMDKIDNLISQSTLNHQQINSIVDHINDQCETKAKVLVDKFNKRLKTNFLYLDQDHFEKAQKYLISKHMNKHGILQDDTPFKSTEQIMILSNLKNIQLVLLHNAGNILKAHYIPLYRAIFTDDLYFDYFVFNKEIQII